MSFLDELNPFEAIPCIDIEDLKTVDPSTLFNDICIPLKEPKSKKFIDFFQYQRRMRYGHEGLLPSEYVHEYHKIKNVCFRNQGSVARNWSVSAPRNAPLLSFITKIEPLENDNCART